MIWSRDELPDRNVIFNGIEMYAALLVIGYRLDLSMEKDLTRDAATLIIRTHLRESELEKLCDRYFPSS